MRLGLHVRATVCVRVSPEGPLEVDVIYLDSEDDLTSNLTLLRERNKGKTQKLVVFVVNICSRITQRLRSSNQDTE